MKHFRRLRARAGFFLAATLFVGFVAAPNVLAAGYTWTEQSGSPTQYWNAIGSSGDGKYLAACAWPGYVYTSSDYGATWTPLTSFGSSQWCLPGSVALSADGKYQIVAGDDTLMSSDYGATWTSALSPGPDVLDTVSMSSDGKYVAAATSTTSPGNGDIWTSSDYGHTWTDRTTSGNQNWSSIASSSDGSHIAAVVNNGDIFTSSDYGATWTDQTSVGTRYWSGIVSSYNGQYVAATVGAWPNTGDIWTSSDYGHTWTDQVSAGARLWSYLTSSASGQYLAAVTGGGGGASDDIYTSSDYGHTWTDQVSAGARLWSVIASNASGSRLATGVWHSDVWTAHDPALDIVSDGGSGRSSTPGSSTFATSNDAAAPNTGYGRPVRSNLISMALITGAITSTGAGLLVLYRQKSGANETRKHH